MLVDVLTIVADVMTTKLQILYADVVAMVINVKTTQDVCAIWQMLQPIVLAAITIGQHVF